MTGYDVLVIGGGQAGLSAGYYLRRSGREFLILDAEQRPGGAWQHYWQSMRIFSPAEYSSLPGWPMPAWDGYPPASHVVDYLTGYERRYRLPVRRPVLVTDVVRREVDDGPGYRVSTSAGVLTARVVINATGSWRQPFLPAIRGMGGFRGTQLHTVEYRDPRQFAGQRVAVVGGGNSAAQIIADLADVAEPLWFTRRPPRFIPDEYDGSDLFTVATRATNDPDAPGVADLGDIVMVQSVRRARDLGVLRPRPMFARVTENGVISDGTEIGVDAIIWCTGFRPALRHLRSLGIRDDRGRLRVRDNRLDTDPDVLFLGYGDWTGAASATLIGVARSARELFRGRHREDLDL